MAAKTLGAWVDGLQAKGRYTFRRDEALSEGGVAAEAVNKALLRLTRKGRLVKAKAYFYVIVPIEYADAGAPPPEWFIHDLMAAMSRPLARYIPSQDPRVLGHQRMLNGVRHSERSGSVDDTSSWLLNHRSQGEPLQIRVLPEHARCQGGVSHPLGPPQSLRRAASLVLHS